MHYKKERKVKGLPLCTFLIFFYFLTLGKVVFYPLFAASQQYGDFQSTRNRVLFFFSRPPSRLPTFPHETAESNLRLRFSLSIIEIVFDRCKTVSLFGADYCTYPYAILIYG